MLYKTLIFTALIVGAFSCGSRPDISDHPLMWIVGTWVTTGDRQIVYETWKSVREHEWAGRSYSIKSNDTIVHETIQILRQDGHLYYIPTVTGQNNGRSVRFPLKMISQNHMLFENKAHDFPQRISYRRITADSLVAEVSGNQNGRERIETFSMKRQ